MGPRAPSVFPPPSRLTVVVGRRAKGKFQDQAAARIARPASHRAARGSTGGDRCLRRPAERDRRDEQRAIALRLRLASVTLAPETDYPSLFFRPGSRFERPTTTTSSPHCARGRAHSRPVGINRAPSSHTNHAPPGPLVCWLPSPGQRVRPAADRRQSIRNSARRTVHYAVRFPL